MAAQGLDHKLTFPAEYAMVMVAQCAPRGVDKMTYERDEGFEDFESFPAEWQYQSRGMGIQSLWRDAHEEFFSLRDWRQLAGGSPIIWHDEFGVKYVVTRCDDPLDRDEFLVPYSAVEADLAEAAFEADEAEWREIHCYDDAWEVCDED